MLFRLFKINAEDSKYGLFILFLVEVALCVGLFLSVFYPLHWGQDITVLEGFMEVNATIVSICFAAFTFLVKSKKLEDVHKTLLDKSLYLTVVSGLVLLILDIIGVASKSEGAFVQMMVAGEVGFLLLLVSAFAAFFLPGWSTVVLDNNTKNEQYIKKVKELKELFRSFSASLDDRFNTFSYFSQISDLASAEMLSKDDIKFLKGLNDIVDDTKIGKHIKDVDGIVVRFKSILKRLED